MRDVHTCVHVDVLMLCRQMCKGMQEDVHHVRGGMRSCMPMMPDQTPGPDEILSPLMHVPI